MAAAPHCSDTVNFAGGILGCSIPDQLVNLSIRDVELLERSQLTCRTTWHPAGLLPQLHSPHTWTELVPHTSEWLKTQGAEIDEVTGIKPNGSVTLTEARFEECKRIGAMGSALGAEVELLAHSGPLQKYPLLPGDAVVEGLSILTHAKTKPVAPTMACAEFSRPGGTRIFKKTAVLDILIENGRAAGAHMQQGGQKTAIRVTGVCRQRRCSSSGTTRKRKESGSKDQTQTAQACVHQRRAGALTLSKTTFKTSDWS